MAIAGLPRDKVGGHFPRWPPSAFIWNDKMGGHFSRWPPSAYIWIKTNVVVAELVVYLVSRIFLGRIKYVLFMSYKDKHVRSTLGGGIETNQSINHLPV